MKKIKTFVLIFLLTFYFTFKVNSPEPIHAWGFDGHKKITEKAIEQVLLLKQIDGISKLKLTKLKNFLSKYKEQIIDRCIEPDMVRNEDKDEQYNHFIDIDRYGTYPFSELPRDKRKAIEKFGFETVQKNGFLPWRIAEFTDSLSNAISKSDTVKMLRYFSWLAHYVADAHQPLHVTENYDGQLTNQPGIHSRFETELVKFLTMNQSLKVDLLDERGFEKSFPIKNLINFSFDIVLESYNLIKPILDADSYAKSQIPSEKLYRVEKRDGRTRYIYSDEYYKLMADRLRNLVEDRFSKASFRLALLWLTAMERSDY